MGASFQNFRPPSYGSNSTPEGALLVAAHNRSTASPPFLELTRVVHSQGSAPTHIGMSGVRVEPIDPS